MLRCISNKSLIVALMCLLAVGCKPSRWEHVDVQQINAAGEVVETWEDVEIIKLNSGGLLSCGPAWVRFKKRDGKQVTLNVPHRFLYR